MGSEKVNPNNAFKKLTDDDYDDNRGYDNSRSDYNFIVNDHIAYRYKILSSIGKGSFG